MRRILWSCLLLVGLGCGGPKTDELQAPAELSLSVSADTMRAHPQLLERLARSPIDYFRFVSDEFARAVCREFEEIALPRVILHGDAHIGQFAITDAGYGLDDFDAGCQGPPTIDLVRFSTSIVLACRARGWQAQQKELVHSFLERYLYALREGKAREPQPEFVTRALASFPEDRRGFLDFVESVVEPMDPVEATAMHAALGRYVRVRGDQARAGFFELKSGGPFRLGIGSALDRKYLWRVEGATDSNEDDVVLEMHEVRPLRKIDCTVSEGAHPADRVLHCARVLGRIEDPWGGRVPLGPAGEPAFRMHTWQAHFVEVDPLDPEFSVGDLRDLVLVAGEQLGSGHVGSSGSRLQSQKVALAIDGLEPRIEGFAIEMADETEAAFEHFRRTLEE